MYIFYVYFFITQQHLDMKPRLFFFFQLTLIFKRQKLLQVPIIISIETIRNLHPHSSYLFRSLQKESVWPLKTNWICLRNGPHQEERLRTFNLKPLPDRF